MEKLELDYEGTILEEKVHLAQTGAPPSGERDEAGKFTKGNKGGPGNPFNRRVCELRKLLLEAVGPAELRAMLDAVLAKAKAGDVAAAKLILQYAIGKPTPAPDPDRVDVAEWQLTRDRGISVEEATRRCLDVPVKEAVKGTDLLRDLMYVGQRKRIHRELCDHAAHSPIPLLHFDEDEDPYAAPKVPIQTG
jgi:hypothetical protein